MRRLSIGGLAIALLLGLSSSALTQSAAGRNRNDGRAGQYGGSLDARQHGYEHAYRDGADRGRQDRDNRMGYGLRDDDYLYGARTYEGFFGDRADYMRGYREGYKAGYDDGYNDRSGQYGQLYGRPAGGSRRPSGADPYAARRWGAEDLAFDAGYREGITAGAQDQQRNARSSFRQTDAYRNADRGYRTSSGDRDAYRMQFRDGFERGYADGYGGSRYSADGPGIYVPDTGRYGAVNPNPGRTGAVDTRGFQAAQTRTIVIPANRQWTPTGIRVNQGDTLRFESTGEIRFTPNADDRAVSAGSLAHKFVPGAPLPAAFAGALVGRIDSGQPFGIGDQQWLVMPASGILYLGVNDDNVSDNSGQFQVVISW